MAHKTKKYGVEYYSDVHGNGTRWFETPEKRDDWLHCVSVDDFYLLDRRTPEDIFYDINKNKDKKEHLEALIKDDYKRLIELLAKDQGLKVGDKVEVNTGEVVYISKFYISSSQLFRYESMYNNKTDKEIAAKMGIKKFALYAECYASNKDGSKNKKESPEYNRRTLEGCKKV